MEWILSSLNDPEYRRLVDELVEARLAARLSQTAFGKVIGRPQSFVSKYEHYVRRLDVIEYVRICGALDVDPISAIRSLI